MSVIAVISRGEKFDNKQVAISDASVFYVCGLNTKRKLKRFILRNHIERAVICGDVPAFTRGELDKLGVAEYNGDSLMKIIYPKIISRAAKMSGDCEMCTLYDTFADGLTVEIIKCAASHFRYVSLDTDADAENIATEIMASTGLALKIGKSGGVGIIRSEAKGKHGITADIRGCGTTIFSDDKRHLFTAAIAEAVLGDNVSGEVLERHKIKIHSL